MSNSFKNIFVVPLFALIFLLLGALIEKQILKQRLTVVSQALDTIYQNFDGEVNQDKLLKTMLTTLDTYSYYLTRDEYQKVLTENQGNRVGVGIIYTTNNKGLKILSILPHSPAEDAHIQKYSFITHINGIDVSTLTLDQIGLAFKGPEGQQISLNVESPSQKKEITLTRQKLKDSILFNNISDETAYIKIYSFWPTTGNEFDKLMTSLQNKNKIILDLRDNLGGDTEAMLKIAANFISNGPILIEKFKNEPDIVTSGVNNASLAKKRVIVLTNHETSSASEQLATALKGRERFTLIGEKTFGKGSTGSYFELKDGSALHMTTEHWYTYKNEFIGGKGVEPDIVIKDEISDDKDLMLEQALNNN